VIVGIPILLAGLIAIGLLRVLWIVARRARLLAAREPIG
jgi:hypothetical protein